MRPKKLPGGPLATAVAKQIKASILSQELAPNELLPSVRQLSAERKIAPKTVFQGLRMLVEEGLVVPEPGRGYRVLPHGRKSDMGMPVAFALSSQAPGEPLNRFNALLLSALQSAAISHGWSLLGTGSRGMSADAIVEQCQRANAWGLIADVYDPAVTERATRAGLPVVLVNAWHVKAKADTVLQDGFIGGYLAAKHLIELGHCRIAWVGQISESIHGMARFSGARSALMEAGIEFDRSLVLELPEGVPSGAVIDLLNRSDRPTGILALWQARCLEAVRAAQGRRIELGKDLDLVGWCPEEDYDLGYRASFGGYVPPTITWSIASMAHNAIARLAQRRMRPSLPPLWMNIEVKLVVPGKPNGGGA